LRHMSGNSADISKGYFDKPIGGSNPLWSASFAPRIACGRDRIWKASVIRSEIRSRAELNHALPLFLHPSRQRDTAHSPIGTGRLRARPGFGYWGEQIGYLRDQSGLGCGRARSCSIHLRRYRSASTRSENAGMTAGGSDGSAGNLPAG